MIHKTMIKAVLMVGRVQLGGSAIVPVVGLDAVLLAAVLFGLMRAG